MRKFEIAAHLALAAAWGVVVIWVALSLAK
jgi:hypothetical protein